MREIATSGTRILALLTGTAVAIGVSVTSVAAETGSASGDAFTPLIPIDPCHLSSLAAGLIDATAAARRGKVLAAYSVSEQESAFNHLSEILSLFGYGVHALGTGGEDHFVWVVSNAAGESFLIKTPKERAAPGSIEAEEKVLVKIENSDHPGKAYLPRIVMLPGPVVSALVKAKIRFVAETRVPGAPLLSFGVARRAPFRADEVKRLRDQALLALAAIHAVGYAHYDVTERNLMIDFDPATSEIRGGGLIDFSRSRELHADPTLSDWMKKRDNDRIDYLIHPHTLPIDDSPYDWDRHH